MGAAFLVSRCVVILSSLGGIAVFGYSDQFDTERGINPYDGVARALFSSVGAWDAGQYLGIALQGYEDDAARMVFFPLYPLLIHGLGSVIGSAHLAALLISCCAFLAALYLLYRLTELELDGGSARRAVALTAFCPMALFFSAIYTESLFLALSLGCVYGARLGRWPVAGGLGALAALTRNSGVLLLVPVTLLLLYGPRADRPPRAPMGTGPWHRHPYAIGGEALWLLLIPAGTVTYLGYSAITTGDPFTPLSGQAEFGRHFTGPLVALVDAVRGAGASIRDILAGASLLGVTGGDAFVRNRPFEARDFRRRRRGDDRRAPRAPAPLRRLRRRRASLRDFRAARDGCFPGAAPVRHRALSPLHVARPLDAHESEVGQRRSHMGLAAHGVDGSLRHLALRRLSAPMPRGPQKPLRITSQIRWESRSVYARPTETRGTGADWLCRACHNVANREYRQRNRERLNAGRRRDPPPERTCRTCGQRFIPVRKDQNSCRPWCRQHKY